LEASYLWEGLRERERQRKKEKEMDCQKVSDFVNLGPHDWSVLVFSEVLPVMDDAIVAVYEWQMEQRYHLEDETHHNPLSLSPI